MTSVKSLPGAKPRGMIFLMDYNQLKTDVSIVQNSGDKCNTFKDFLRFFLPFDSSAEQFGWLVLSPLP
jgi:hypothetical protein